MEKEIRRHVDLIVGLELIRIRRQTLLFLLIFSSDPILLTGA